MAGLALLLGIALAGVVLLGTVAVVRGVTRPPRKTLARALGRSEPTDPADLDLRAAPITVPLADGAASPGWLIAGDSPEGPAVVILHGFGDSRYGTLTWVGLVQPYASRILVYDQRGHGESTAAVSCGGAPEAADVLHAIAELLPECPVVLFGYSMGAQIAIAAAGRAEEQLRRRLIGVVAEGPYRRWPVPVARMMRCRGYPVQPMLWLAQQWMRWRGGPSVLFDRCEDAAALTCPLLVIHGERDPICPLADAKALAEAAPVSEFVHIADGGHLDLATLAPDQYHKALTMFFERVRSAPISASVM